MRVLINGGGNIGTTLAGLLVKYKNQLGIGEIYLHKNFPQPWKEADLAFIEEQGVLLCGQGFKHYNDVATSIDYIFETTTNGVGLTNKPSYETLPKLIGASAQGSEKGFGIPFMSGVNEEKVKGQKFVQVVSCNTHGAVAILKVFGGDKLENIKSADFVVVRRSEDLGNHERLVSANVVARHLDATIGTHHSIDALDLLKTIDLEIPLTSSDITTPSQLLHSTRFNIELNQPIKGINALLAGTEFISTTNKFDSNQVFELGRRYGFQGRIYSHAIVVSNNILLNGNTIKGWAFVPQEGNTLLSTIHAYLLQTSNPNANSVINVVRDDLLLKQL